MRLVNFIDNLLNQITMYRLVLYYLIALVVIALGCSLFGVFSFTALQLLVSTVFIVVMCWVVNKLFAWAFDTPTNVESFFITALILVLIIAPVNTFTLQGLALPFFASVLAIGSKFILALHKKHLFNPAAIAVVLTAYGFHGSANWWVGNIWMLPFVLVGGLLVLRKIQREDMVFSFLALAVVTSVGSSVVQGHNALQIAKQILIDSPLFFLSFVMLTEPLTTPPTKKLQIIYGGIIGFLFAPLVHVGSWYTTPELALILGNVYSYIVSPKEKLLLKVEKKLQISPDIFEFVFHPHEKLVYLPGQYMEWTLPHKGADSRGNRRYFTLASSPTEPNLRLGVRFYPHGSSYKKAMQSIHEKNVMLAGQVAGDFVLPEEKSKKYAFIAGGIGITPFRSMIKYLVDKKEKRDIVLLYANKIGADAVYTDVFDQAKKELGIKTIYTVTDRTQVPEAWKGYVGRIDEKMIEKEVTDWKERIYYLSGPHSLVVSYEELLQKMGVSNEQIKKDFFPGFA